jgi:hypothetical protein
MIIDGPPFATGLPHYGHILAGTIKVSTHSHSHTRSLLLPPIMDECIECVIQ